MFLTDSPTLKTTKAPNVAQAILRQLELYGVKRIYGVIGDAIFGLMDAISKQSEIQFIAVKHESVAGMMASAEAKYTGGLGVCAAQMGPGLANLINGLGDAYLDNYPLLAITGQTPLKKIGTSYKQFVNQQELVQGITSYSQLVTNPDSVIDSLIQAINKSLTLGTVSHLSIPTDVFTMSTLAPLNEPTPIAEYEFCPRQLNKGLKLMQSAAKPMILVGDKAGSAIKEIQQLAKIWGAGIATSYGAIGILPDSDPYLLGGLGEGGNPLLGNLFKLADVVLAIDTNWWPEEQIPQNASVIQIHNKQTNLGKGMPVDCGIIGNPTGIIAQLINGLKSHRGDQNWIGQIQQCKEAWAKQNEEEGKKSGYPLHPSRIVRAIEKYTSPETVITLDEGDSTLWFMRNFRAQCKQVLLSKNWRTMGFGLPAAMTTALCSPDRQVICVTGDGGIAMVLADLLTAKRYGLKITVVLLNNGQLQMEYNKMVEKGLSPEGTKLTNPDFVKLAEACGWDALRVQTENDLEKLIEAALKNRNPVLIDVPTTQVPYPNYQNT